jgi:heptosyltransferase III
LLFLKPLGTFINMLPNVFSVNVFCMDLTRFPQIISALFPSSYRRVTVNLLCIKQAVAVLFCDTETAVRRLLIRPGAIGDFILALPALECLRTGYTEVWAASPNVPLVRFADRAQSIAATGIDLLGITDPDALLIEELRGFDSIVSWYGANRPEFRELVAGLGLRFTFFDALPRDGAVHASDFYLDQARTIARCESDGIPRIPCPVARENFAVIQPFSSSPKKNWPLANFRRMAAAIERRMPVQWCRGPEDPPLAGAVTMDNLHDLAGWLARASLYVGNDSGITHLAAAVGTPVLALFGPTDPEVWGPRGEHVRIAKFSGTKSI